MDKVSRAVDRTYVLTSPEAVSEHIRAIGKAIMEDADRMRVYPNNISRITITAHIEPCTELTNITYEIDRMADPRCPRTVDDGVEEET